ncbi:magnesium/cobalt transporter CorA [Gracilibacillus caseinilyticus]|uniref:Magnesium transport protein CorA n=1 Tax=Gracilibacillus caseinilyticus TaxID=2932256 RepID=A0ABY4EY38_9BACI|nr:magnesium/cobalt transporter CorA [Gracilibacillus caseinilyticus]UOQ49330.1 magnesium/cobalt transporter CorA [Gracilibacillus caseinilyticus]
MIHTLGITHDNQIETDIAPEANLEVYKWFWVDFDTPTDEEIQHLSKTFQFHPLAIEDCIQRLQRPKLDYYDDHTFFVTHFVKEDKDEDELIKEEINFFVGDQFVVSFHRQPSKEVSYVRERLAHGKVKVEKWDTYFVFYQILDKIVDNYFPYLYEIEDNLDKIEENTHNKSMNQLMTELFDTRYQLLTLRHVIHPMRDLLYRMLNSQHLDGIRGKREYYSDIYDHLLKLSEMVMSNREITVDIRDSYMSMNSLQTNNVMKLLTIITSVFVPLTFIAGIYGMNFQYMPELHMRYGYFISLAVMLVVGVGMIIWFWKKGWFK